MMTREVWKGIFIIIEFCLHNQFKHEIEMFKQTVCMQNIN